MHIEGYFNIGIYQYCDIFVAIIMKTPNAVICEALVSIYQGNFKYNVLEFLFGPIIVILSR